MEGLTGSEAGYVGTVALVDRPNTDQALYLAVAGNGQTVKELVGCDSSTASTVTVAKQRQENGARGNDAQALAEGSLGLVERGSRDSEVKDKSPVDTWTEDGFSADSKALASQPSRALIDLTQQLCVRAEPFLEVCAATARWQAARLIAANLCSLATQPRPGKFDLPIILTGEYVDSDCQAAGTSANRLIQCCSFVCYVPLHDGRQIYIQFDKRLLRPTLCKRIRSAPIEDRGIASRRTQDALPVLPSETETMDTVDMPCPLAPRMDFQPAIVSLPEPREDEMLPESMTARQLPQKLRGCEQGTSSEGAFELRCNFSRGMSARLKQVLRAIRSGETR
ncbi:hypothetical protein TGRUB_226260 [Toxoplasma gondii RUB]|uniref:Uncharacterized protein n=10 Tax=Toxoplasma gondii TaxID=5811 RepID=B9PMM3_TOXGV|nr:hypothetical protein TGGT1_226260 [Toxoplasma gondii GT1]ESS32659.1 hypothetical protein TGVEG_226260 [Toxoplasma gondii VEG]KFG42688.1 hypothetical protein TGP89_226260 [Toxoplasma gondii p89]KFG51737.1 hypothetical protein TGFOU_226260 [Toxoplasma gondii FOU]KFG60880.1 hypothetical protein TGRUB_226260 [Toxoplasma gondii RUB]KFH09658.1 hypothetical protein TGMAS_226260 [Toxoplasma gondii MAS]KFH13157.1 hypothetical protein TGVAND_226260 [Toxoplasma gondii VAND]PIM04047.1 hypothetical pr